MSDKMVPVVRLHGQEYLLVGDMVSGGAIATPEQYRRGECSYAHLFADGTIRRFNRPIGTRDDLEVIEQTTLPTPAEDALLRIIGWGWGDDE